MEMGRRMYTGADRSRYLALDQFNRRSPENRSPLTAQKKIAPGKAGAILTLADGTQLVLDSLGNGTVTTQNGSQVSLENGHLSYDPTNASGIVAYNTMTTPRGRQFQLTLPDGTGVWLNAASSITYPVSFSGRNRKVTITGEAYLEVARNSQQPFLVDVDGKSAGGSSGHQL